MAHSNETRIELLKNVGILLKKNKFTIGNIDATIICQRPKLLPYRQEMVKNVADLEINQIIADAKEKIISVIRREFFTKSYNQTIELRRYVRIGETDYDSIKKVAIQRGVMKVYFPNNKEEYAWRKISLLSIHQLVIVYQSLKNN